MIHTISAVEKGVHNMYPSKVRPIEKRLHVAMDRVAVKLIWSLDRLATLEKNIFHNFERDNKESRKVINQIIRCIYSTEKLVKREFDRYRRYNFDRDLLYCVKTAVDFSETVLETLSCRHIDCSISIVYDRLLSKFKDSVVDLSERYFSTHVFLKHETCVRCNDLEDYYVYPDPPTYPVVIKNGSIFIDKGEL